MAKSKVERDAEALRKIKKKSVLRGIKELDIEDLEEVIITGEEELAKHEAPPKGGWVHINEIGDEIDEAFDKWGKVGGLSTGYPSLDAKVGGLKPGELLLVGGETNQGKSALAQNIAVNVALHDKVGYISLEMLKGEAGSRIKHMNGGTREGLDLYFQHEYQMDYRHIEPLFENAVKHGVKLVILDYLQYLGRGMNLDEVAKMSKLMKAMALKFQLPFIVIVSLRKSDSGKFKRKWTDIEVEDLMGTSAIGYDADVAMVASRRDLDNKYDTNHFFVKVIKSRNMPLDYDDRFLKFKWDKTKILENEEKWVPKPNEKVEEISEEQFQSDFLNSIDKA